MTIKTKFAAIFFSLVILPVVAGTTILFYYVKDIVKDVRFLQLENIANLEKERLDAFFLERQGDARVFQSYAVVKDILPVIDSHPANPDGPKYRAAESILLERMSALKNAYGYHDIMLADRSGIIVLSTAGGGNRVGRPLSDIDAKAFDAGKAGIYLSRLFNSAASVGKEDYHILMAAPLLGHKDEFIGEVVFEIDLEHVFEYLRAATGLGTTGDTFLGVPDGDNVLFISSFHTRANRTFKATDIFNGRRAIPMQRALSGVDGSGEYFDYLGNDIYAAWRAVPSLGWGLVAKIDSSEAVAPVETVKHAAMAAELIILFMFLAAATLLTRSIIKPIGELKKGMEIIGSGDLEHIVGTDSGDEIGQLSRDLDKMTANLRKVTASRDELDAEVIERKRTEEVLRASIRLSEYSLKHSLEELLTNALDEAEVLTGSQIGFFHFVEADQKTLQLQAWSTNTIRNMCSAEGRGQHYPIDQAGVWVDAVVQRVPVIHNDYKAMPDRKGLPPGHAPVIRELVVPILRNEQVVGVLGVGNKTEEYENRDVDAVSRLANLAWDIIVAKMAEEQVKRFNEELELRVVERTAELTAANNELEAFSYSVSHDLRSPLRHVQGYIDLLIKNSDSSLDEKGRRYLDTISAAAIRMGKLVDDLLAFSRMGRTEMRKSRVDLRALADTVIRELKEDAKDREVTWEIHDLPDAYGDPSMLRLVISNLLSNAFKFTATREHAVIELGSMPGNENETVYFVKDNGVGFDMQYVGKLFGVFQRLHRPEEFEGTGIGLANVRRIISRHGGRTWAEGAPGKGAVIYFTLPVRG